MASKLLTLPTRKDVMEANAFFRQHPGLVYRTHLIHSATLSNETEAQVYLKPENLQQTGSFKIRGASFKLGKLSEDERQAGVITASLGNHAQGVAYAAQQLRIPCTVVMPSTATPFKVERTRSYGATVELHGETYDDAYARALEKQQATGATLIHAFNDPLIIAGQGTIGSEIMSDLRNVDMILVPIGGGGLISGIAIAMKSLNEKIKVIGVQAEGAQAAKLSRERQKLVAVEHPHTIADGINTKRPGEMTFEIMNKYVDDIVVVTDEEIVHSVVWLLERTKLLVEAAGAVSVAALRCHFAKRELQNKTVVALLSGGNIDATTLDHFIRYSMAAERRIVNINVVLPDQPGSLETVLSLITEKKANILDIVHQRTIPALSPQEAQVTLTVETLNSEQSRQLLAKLRERHFLVDSRRHKR